MSLIHLRNNLLRFKNIALVFCGVVSLCGSAQAQINVDQLGAAQAYDVGTIQSGGLDSALWQGTSAVQATELIEKIDTNASGSARTLIRTALLSGGVPPHTNNTLERETYVAARLSAVLGLGDLAAFDSIAEQSGINRTSPVFTKIFAERALLGGDAASACAITDNITIERKSPYWAKLRAFCHVVRDEMPAAELTVDLLTRSDHKDDSFFNLLGALMTPQKGKKKTNFAPDIIKTPLDTALARLLLEKKQVDLKIMPPVLAAEIAVDASQEKTDRLSALFIAAPVLSKEQIRTALIFMAEDRLEHGEELEKFFLNPEDHSSFRDIQNEETWNFNMWGPVYYMLRGPHKSQTAALAAELLARAESKNIFADIARVLEPNIERIPAEFQTKHKPEIFARTAVLRGDIDTLRSLFQALEADNPLRGRIALASDALGNGFMLGELGVDIETRLALTGKSNSQVQGRAVRDTYIAVAMGANLSATAEQVLRDAKLKGSTVHPGALLALQAAVRRGSKAEVALRVAPMIEGKPLRADDFAAVLTAMAGVGMHEQAGKLAALDILQ